MKPFFSIIVPVYNVAPYLRECLDSVLAQTFTDWECLCVDDGSTDESGVILDEYAQKDSRFRVFHKPNAGVSAARNLGLDNVRGEWIWFVDSDDAICFDALECFYKLTTVNPLVDVFFFPEVLKYEVDTLFSRGSGMLTKELLNQRGFELLNVKGVMGRPYLRLIKASKFRHIKFCVGVVMMEDLLHLVESMDIIANWAIVDLFAYRYRTRHNSATWQRSQKHGESAVYVYSRIMNLIKGWSQSSDGFIRDFWRHRRGGFDCYLRIGIGGPSYKCAMLCIERYYQLRSLFTCEMVGFPLRCRCWCVKTFKSLSLGEGIEYLLLIFKIIFLRFVHLFKGE